MMTQKTHFIPITALVTPEIYDFVTKEKGVYSYSSYVENLLYQYMMGVKEHDQNRNGD